MKRGDGFVERRDRAALRDVDNRQRSDNVRNVKFKVKFPFLRAAELFRLLPAGIFFTAGLFFPHTLCWYPWRAPHLDGIFKEKKLRGPRAAASAPKTFQ